MSASTSPLASAAMCRSKMSAVDAITSPSPDARSLTGGTITEAVEHDHSGAPLHDAASWNERYRSSSRLWSGNPNPQLVAEVAGMPPGLALDAGCGEGADAIWLARQGWTVVATDIST